MRRLPDLSIRHRLTLVMVLASSLAVTMAGLGQLVFEGAGFYGEARDDIASLADVTAANVSAALAFGDRPAAQEMLDALRSRAGIVCAGLYDAQGRPFAGYCRPGGGTLPHEPGSDRLELDGRSLVLVRPVMLGEDRAGTMLIRASLQRVLDHLVGYAFTVLVTALVAVGVAALVSARLQRAVSHPILLLAETARTVTRDGDYSRRAPRLGRDELGVLTDDFNAMLARIEEQDAALRAARDELGLWLAAQQEDLRHESVERRRAEDLARRLVQAVQCSREMISIADCDDRFVFVNQAFLAAYGFHGDEVLGRPATLVDSPNNPKGLRLQIEKATRMGGWHGELLNRRKDGSEFPASLGTSVIRDEQGAIVGLLGVARDISERKESEERLRLQEAALAATVDAVVIADRDGRIEWVNPAFTRLTGYEPAEAVGRNPRFLKSGAHPREFYEAMWKTLLEGRVWYGQLSNRRKDGTLYTEEMTITPVLDETGDIAHFAAIKRDISERLALESQLHGARKMESLGQLAGGVAHDFNNLLGVIQGYSELLAGRLDAADRGQHHVHHILDAADRAAKLTRQLLAFGRRQVLEPRVVDLNGVVGGVEMLLRRLVGEAVEVVVKTAPDLGRVRVDPGQVDQVLLNLAANARDAMPRGGRLTIETSNEELGEAECRSRGGARPGSFVRLRVSDTGHGMDEATRARVFEPFFTTKDVGQGTGLGLATVYGIVKQSGGYVCVESAPGKGASFDIYLPRVLGQVDAREPGPASPTVRTPATILLVEDEASLREIASELLEASGYTVIAAANGKDALAIAEQPASGPIHLLLSDVMMPGLSGPALARRVREHWPDVEVLYMSGYSREAVEKQGALEPGSRLLAKPFSLNTLVRSVEEALA